MIFARKIFFRNLGATAPLPPSPTPMVAAMTGKTGVRSVPGGYGAADTFLDIDRFSASYRYRVIDHKS